MSNFKDKYIKYKEYFIKIDNLINKNTQIPS